jgi:hypothetical protein
MWIPKDKSKLNFQKIYNIRISKVAIMWQEFRQKKRSLSRLELDIVPGARANTVEYDSTVNQYVLTMFEPTNYL